MHCISESAIKATTTTKETGYLNAKDAAQLDVELMSTPGYSLEQLMELAGLSVAEAIFQLMDDDFNKKIIILCGPGNNGGDGLVAARHLHHFGFQQVEIVYPKPSKKSHFINLVQQCQDLNIPILSDFPSNVNSNEEVVIVDALFGFSFQGPPIREPLNSCLEKMIELNKSNASAIKVIAVDVPSGWNVNEGDIYNLGFIPDVIISLTAPKLCVQNYTGRHFIGGRFLPQSLSEKYHVKMPPYPGVSQVLEVPIAINDNDNDVSGTKL